MKTKKRSIRSRIQLLYSVFIVLFFLSVILTLYFSISNLYHEESENNVKQFQSIVVDNIDRFKGNIESDILQLILEPNLQRILSEYDGQEDEIYLGSELIQEIHFIVDSNQDIAGCDIIANDGSFIKASDYKDQGLLELFPTLDKEPYYPYGWYGPYELEKNNGFIENVFVVRKSIISSGNGEELGDLFAYVNEDSLTDIFEPLEELSNSDYYVLNRDKEVIAPSERIATFEENLIASEQYVHSLDTNMDAWSVISITSMRNFQQAFTDVQTILMIVTAIGIAAILIMTGSIAKKLTGPIHVMVRTMEEIGEGNRDLRLKIKELKSKEFIIMEDSFNRLMDRNDSLLKEVYDKQERIRQYSFLLLQEQIKPHFMYNSLSTVSALIKLDMQGEAVETVDNLANFFRITLNSGQQIYSLAEEKEMIESYLTVQKYRYHGKIEYKIDMDDNIEKQCIPKLTLQPLIENAIYHGARGRSELTIINISGRKNGEIVIFEVRDDGNGMSQDKINDIYENVHSDNGKNFGLTCVNQQLKILFGEGYDFRIESKPGKFTAVYLTLPFRPIETDNDIKKLWDGK